jgi:hypothetical protein
MTRGDYTTLDIAGLFRDLGSECKPAGAAGKFWVTCPWEDQHGETGKSDTVIWQPSDGVSWPVFHCSHNSCDGKKLKPDVIEWANSRAPGIVDSHCRQQWNGNGSTSRPHKPPSAHIKPFAKPLAPEPLPLELKDATPPEFLAHVYKPSDRICLC